LERKGCATLGVEENERYFDVYRDIYYILLKKIGGLSSKDQEAVRDNLKKLMSLDDSK
jgi:hypothetical protein